MTMVRSQYSKTPNYDSQEPNHIILWLDVGIGDPTKYVHLKTAFASNTNPRAKKCTMLTEKNYHDILVEGDAVKVIFEGVVFLLQAFDNEDACLAAFEKYQDKRIFFITSGSLGKTAVPKIIAQYQRVFTDLITDKPYASVYVFCHNIEYHMAWGMEYLEYVQMFNFDSELLERLTRDIAEYFIERSGRIREDNNLESALQHLHWAKRLWCQYDKMQQKIDIDNRREVAESQRIKEINKMIAEFERDLPQTPSYDQDSEDDYEDGENKGCEAGD